MRSSSRLASPENCSDMRVIASPLAVRNSLLSGSENTVLFMSSSYETWEESATQDKRKGRRTVLATSDDFLKCNRTGHLLQGAPPKTGRADFGAHGATHHRPGVLSRDARPQPATF